MSDDEDFDDLYGAEDYYYVEDEYGPADDLAERACPSPIQYDAEFDDWDEHTRFTSYWADLKYNSDSYLSEHEQDKSDARRRRKRTRGDADDITEQKVKRLKYHTRSTPGSPLPLHEVPPPILWVSRVEQDRKVMGRPAQAVSAKPVVRDWRKLLSIKVEFGARKPKSSLEEVADANEDEGAETRSNEQFAGLGVGPVDVDGENIEASEIESAALKRAIRERLAAAGVKFGGLDEATLMEFALQMMSGADGDDVAGKFADELLDHEAGEDEQEDDIDEGQDLEEEQTHRLSESGLSEWVASQVHVKKALREKRGISTHEQAEPWPPPPLTTEAQQRPGDVLKRKAETSEDHRNGDGISRQSKRRTASTPRDH